MSVVLMFSNESYAQYIKANARVQMEKLSQEQRFELRDFDKLIKEYIESNQWGERDAFDEFNVDITIGINNVRSSFEDVYSALFLMKTSNGYQAADKEWQFPYMNNQILRFDPNIFDALTGLIDFYIYIAIGEEIDKYESLGGLDYFNKAFQISLYGKGDKYSKWWDRREKIIDAYLDESHKPFRNMTSWLYAANYWLIENNPDEAKVAAEEAMKLLKEVIQIPSERNFYTNFFKKKYMYLANIYSPFDDLYKDLMELNPENKEFYLNFKKR